MYYNHSILREVHMYHHLQSYRYFLLWGRQEMKTKRNIFASFFNFLLTTKKRCYVCEEFETETIYLLTLK